MKVIGREVLEMAKVGWSGLMGLLMKASGTLAMLTGKESSSILLVMNTMEISICLWPMERVCTSTQKETPTKANGSLIVSMVKG